MAKSNSRNGGAIWLIVWRHSPTWEEGMVAGVWGSWSQYTGRQIVERDWNAGVPLNFPSFIWSRTLVIWMLLLHILTDLLILIDIPHRYVSMLSLNLDKMIVEIKHRDPFSSKSLEYLIKVQIPWPSPDCLNMCWATRELTFYVNSLDSNVDSHNSRRANAHLILQLLQTYMVCFSLCCPSHWIPSEKLAIDFCQRTSEEAGSINIERGPAWNTMWNQNLSGCPAYSLLSPSYRSLSEVYF